MFVGVGRIALHIPAARSLKDRRQIVRSFKERVQARMHVSIAEIGDLELHQRAEIGFAVVSNDARVCDEVISQVVHAAGTLRDAVLLDHASEIVPFGEGGRSLRGGLGDTPGELDPRSPFHDDQDPDDA